MPRFEPFAGLRYNPSVSLDLVIAPPYDVVSSSERETLAARDPSNSIHVELPAENPELGEDRYAVAAKLLAQWIEEGTLRQDPTPSLYSYRMTEPNGRATTGVIGALGCEPPGGDVLPHEQTIPKDMSDRLQLLRACRANLSPIWGLSLTEGLAKRYAPVGLPHGSATDDSGVIHEIWAIDDPSVIESITTAVSETPVVIADGHHRYETALAYQSERRAASSDAAGDYDFVMALIVELSEEHLEVGSIDRVVRVPAGVDVVGAFSKWFTSERIGQADDETVERVVEEKELALVTAQDVFRLVPLDRTIERSGSDLDSSYVLEALDDIPGASVTYSHNHAEVLSDVRSKSASAAVFLRPVTVPQISRWAYDRKRMPPKSTYFYPKPRTGMVYRHLDG